MNIESAIEQIRQVERPRQWAEILLTLSAQDQKIAFDYIPISFRGWVENYLVLQYGRSAHSPAPKFYGILPPSCINIPQPAAWGIIHTQQNITNRNAEVYLRGPICIYASENEAYQLRDKYRISFGYAPPQNLPRGGIVGVCTIDDCVTEHDSPYFSGPYGIVLSDCWHVDLIRCPEQPGIFPTPIRKSNV